MRIGVTLIGLLLATAGLAQNKTSEAVWKWIDKDGVTHYSDQPGPGAVKVDLRIQTYPAPESQSASPAAKRPTKQTETYRSIAITSPASEETLHSEVSSVNVSVRVDPPLQGDDRVRVTLDGQPQGQPGTALNFVFQQVPRGAHTLQASVVGRDGSTLTQSSSVTFYVQQTSILSPTRQPPTGPTGPTPPRPTPMPTPR